MGCFSLQEFLGAFSCSAICTACVLTLLMVLTIIITRKFAQKRALLHLPPSPPGRSIIGHLHLLQQPIHQSLHKLAQKYGPFFYIQMGSKPTVVISSQEWVKEVLHTHDREFAGRPRLEACKRLFYNHRTMIMMDHNPTWRHLRKLYTVQILSAKRVEMFEKARHEELAMSIKLVKKSQVSPDGDAVDIRKLVFNTVGNMMTNMLFSKRSFDASEAIDGRESRFKKMVERFSVLMGTPVLSDLIPWLIWPDVRGCKKKMDILAKEVDEFLEDVLAERIESQGNADQDNEEDSDYLDLLLKLYSNEDGKVDKDSIKCILLDLLVASTDTTTTTIEWAMAELLRNPECMKKLQEEVDTIVVAGEDNITNKVLKDTDLAKPGYLQAVIKESLRFHPPLAIVFRQMCTDAGNGTKVGGYQLPKETRVIFNIWSMGRDTAVWGANADTFCPDRFLGGNVPDPRGQHFQFIPFGTGRRVCPGMNLALTLVPLILANLVQVFNWRIPNGVTLDLSDAAAFTAPMANPLVAVPSLRELR